MAQPALNIACFFFPVSIHPLATLTSNGLESPYNLNSRHMHPLLSTKPIPIFAPFIATKKNADVFACKAPFLFNLCRSRIMRARKPNPTMHREK